jgi:hypothetical protein
MKNENNSQSVIFSGQQFYKILQFDCKTVKLQNQFGGTLFTSLPISTNSKVEVKADNWYTTFNIIDDWGKLHTLRIPNFMKTEIENAILGANKINNDYDPPRPRT